MCNIVISIVVVVVVVVRAGSSMRLVRLKPQGPGPDRGPDRPVQQKFAK